MAIEKEKRYKILSRIILDFCTINNQYSRWVFPEDNAEVIVKGKDVYLYVGENELLTINGTDLVDLNVKGGNLEEIISNL